MTVVDWPNTVAHVDADYFFANCELAKNPQLRGKPVMVLGKLGSCILAKSPEAKQAGITTAMPLWEAKKACPQGVYIHGNFRYYTILSRYLMSLLSEWSPLIEIYSVDEAFMDLKGLRGLYRMPYGRIADRIREEVKNRIGITVSVGVSVNKTLAKMACESRKPDGTTMVPGREISNFLSEIPVGDIPGIGRSRSELLFKYGIKSARQLAETSQTFIQRWFGKTGVLLWRELRGETSFPITKDPPPPKGITRTSSFDKPHTDINAVHGMAVYHLERAIEALYRHRLMVKEIALYLREKSFMTYALKHRFQQPTNDFYDLVNELSRLVKKIPPHRIWRSTGVMLGDFSPASGQQLSIFDDSNKIEQHEKVNQAKLDLNKRFGRTTIRSGTTLFINKKCQRKEERMDLPMF